jgi:prepilin-type N-terminal cleavage/methylation domain-containing protein
MMSRTKHTERGFTLIELLVVIAIIGLLSSVTLAAMSTARAKARDARRMSDLRQMQNALELYRTNFGSYPTTFDPTLGTRVFHGGLTGCFGGYGYYTDASTEGYIPGLARTYIPQLPEDPAPNASNNKCYLYSSDGTDYMIVAYKGAETFNAQLTSYRRSSDLFTSSMAVYTPGAASW